MTFTASLGLRQATLALAAHDPAWSKLFQVEAALISEALAGVAHDIDHIGSTAVPNLAAKPILDIALQANAQTQVAGALVTLGYDDRGMRSGRLFIRSRDGNVRTHNLHLYLPGDPDCRDQITFRDALRANASLRAAYASVKAACAARHPEGGAAYGDCKSGWIAKTEARALERY